jgi:hypothetical protein
LYPFYRTECDLTKRCNNDLDIPVYSAHLRGPFCRNNMNMSEAGIAVLPLLLVQTPLHANKTGGGNRQPWRCSGELSK